MKTNKNEIIFDAINCSPYKDIFLNINKNIMKKLGIIPAVIFSILINNQSYEKDDWFHISYEEIKNSTQLSYYRQKKAIEILQENKLIITKLIGTPAKKYFKINIQK